MTIPLAISFLILSVLSLEVKSNGCPSPSNCTGILNWTRNVPQSIPSMGKFNVTLWYNTEMDSAICVDVVTGKNDVFLLQTRNCTTVHSGTGERTFPIFMMSPMEDLSGSFLSAWITNVTYFNQDKDTAWEHAHCQLVYKNISITNFLGRILTHTTYSQIPDTGKFKIDMDYANITEECVIVVEIFDNMTHWKWTDNCTVIAPENGTTNIEISIQNACINDPDRVVIRGWLVPRYIYKMIAEGQRTNDFVRPDFEYSVKINPQNADKIFFIIVSCGVVTMVIFIATIHCYLTRKDSQEIHQVPFDLRYHFQQALQGGNGWNQVDNDLYRKKLALNSNGWNRMAVLLYQHLHGGSFEIEKAYAVFNSMLVTAFSIHRVNLSRRQVKTPAFVKSDWQEKDHDGRRAWIRGYFDTLVKSKTWNNDGGVPIIAVAHGTSAESAWKICSNGFAHLACIDKGYYGKGMYFTTYAVSSLSYMINKKSPTLIIAYLIPGNPWPTTENRHGKDSLVGLAIKAGYNSHYVLTDKNGDPCEKIKRENFYDEICIEQEPQVVPAYVVYLKPDNLPELGKKFAQKESLPPKVSSSEVELELHRSEELSETVLLLNSADSY